MRAKYALIAAAAMLGLSAGGQAAYAGAGVVNAAGTYGQSAARAFKLLIPAGGHGAGGGAVFWTYGTPYGPMYSEPGRPRHYSSRRHLYHRVKGR